MNRRSFLRAGVGDALVWPSVTGGVRPQGDDHGWSHRTQKTIVYLGHRWFAGIRRRVRFVDLRHTCASHLARGSWGRAWRLDEIRIWLGHSSVRTTERYAHLTPDGLHAAAQTMITAWPTADLRRAPAPENDSG